jgi:peptidoglycan/xylan/chitin deacetylase (PgdA/CDA1 family)
MMYLRFPQGKKKCVTFSYDDGVVQDARLAEIFDRYGLKATFNLNGSSIGKDGWRKRLPLEEMHTAYRNHEVAVHSYTHPFLEQTPSDAMAYEIVKDRECLEGMFGKIIKGMAYPMGTTSDEVVRVLAACGISYARTTKQTERFDIPTDWLRMPATCHHNNPRLMELAKDFVESDVPRMSRLFYVWGHSYEFDNDNNWDRIEQLCAYVGGKDDIWYATNIEIYDYVEAYKRMKTSADCHLIYNPTCQTIWFQLSDGREFSVAPNQTLQIP